MPVASVGFNLTNDIENRRENALKDTVVSLPPNSPDDQDAKSIVLLSFVSMKM